MNDKLAREILSMHAEVLATGTDVTDTLARRYPTIAPLLGLAQTLHSKMEMEEVSAEFVERLHQELIGSTVPTAAPSLTQRQNTGWMLGAAVGSAVTGLAVVWARRANATARAQNVTAA